MYSGTTFNNLSGNILGAHQKINRSAYKKLKLTKEIPQFPTIKKILHFEGKNGPDGLKRKSAGKHEPFHFYDPINPKDVALLDSINDHYQSLVKELRASNQEKSAFEASWLAHAIVDGMTPAHHYPFQTEYEKLSGSKHGQAKKIHHKVLVKGETAKDTIKKNWGLWGARGLLTTHAMFELGVASVIAPVKFGKTPLNQREIEKISQQGVVSYFADSAKEIAELEIYEAYIRRGWTLKMSNVVKKVLVPKIVDVVALAWYSACQDAGIIK